MRTFYFQSISSQSNYRKISNSCMNMSQSNLETSLSLLQRLVSMLDSAIICKRLCMRLKSHAELISEFLAKSRDPVKVATNVDIESLGIDAKIHELMDFLAYLDLVGSSLQNSAGQPFSDGSFNWEKCCTSFADFDKVLTKIFESAKSPSKLNAAGVDEENFDDYDVFVELATQDFLDIEVLTSSGDISSAFSENQVGLASNCELVKEMLASFSSSPEKSLIIQAIAEILSCTTTEEFQRDWLGWQSLLVSICQNSELAASVELYPLIQAMQSRIQANYDSKRREIVDSIEKFESFLNSQSNIVRQANVCTKDLSLISNEIATACTQFQSSLGPSHALSSMADKILMMEDRIHLDEGKRGISSILTHGELYQAANDLIRATKVLIITGFPCLMKRSPPTESDGPPGAVAIARALVSLGIHVVIATDAVNEDVLISSVAGQGLSGVMLELQSFPGGDGFTAEDDKMLRDLVSECDHVVAIERSGVNFEGKYLTMRGFDMSHIMAPLDRAVQYCRGRSTGIGDGGNEVGMGKIYDRVTSSSIPNAQTIACKVATNNLIVASVSNWGGYALAASISMLSGHGCKFLPSCAGERLLIHNMFEAGARDGINSELTTEGVDGMPVEDSIALINDLREICLS